MNVVHGYVNLDNILRDENGHYLLTDFSHSHILDVDQRTRRPVHALNTTRQDPYHKNYCHFQVCVVMIDTSCFHRLVDRLTD